MDIGGGIGKMAFVDYSAIRSRFATKIKTLSGFTESRNPFDDFNRFPNTIAQKRFAVGIGPIQALEEQRESSLTGLMCQTQVQVKYPYRLRPKDQVTDYDLSMDVAQDVIKACTNRSPPLHTNLQIFFQQMEHEITESGEYIITTLQFTVLHQISL